MPKRNRKTDSRSDSAPVPRADPISVNDAVNNIEISPEEIIDDLRARVSELEESLRRVMAERDVAVAALARKHQTREPSLLSNQEDVCEFCHGEGTYWVHDFEMTCKRCNGSGRVSRNS